MRSASLPKELHSDTIFVKGAMNIDSRIAGTRVFGPYSITFSGNVSNSAEKKGTVQFDVSSDQTGFKICTEGDCANAEARYITRSRKTAGLFIRGGITKITSEKISGSVSYLGDTPGFELNVAKGGEGFINLTTGMVRVVPIQRKTRYGKSAYGVGLKYLLNGKVVGAFIQQDEDIAIALNKQLSNKNRIILTAVSLCLMNRSNMVRLF